MESQPEKKGMSDAKRQAIQRFLRQVLADVSAGKTFDEAAIIAAHPELMPELQVGLKRVREIKNTRTPSKIGETRIPPTQTGNNRVGETMLPPSDASIAAGSIHHPSLTEPSASGINGYTLQREIGRGGQAVVYLAIQQSTGRKVAIKLIHRQALADERALARFKREVQVLAALDHPNIVGIVDTGAASDGSQFIVMSYVAGSTLDEYMKVVQVSNDRGKLLRLFLKICDAVNVAHVRGIVHRDLKPGNIRIDERGEPHILDFGLAHTALDHLAGPDHPKSVDGEFLGSLPWSSPEQAQADPDRIDIRSDVYSLGVILYQILTNGRFPYEVVGNIRDILNNILSVPPTPPSKLAAPEPDPAAAPAINPIIEKIVMKALAKNREERYQTAGELGRDVSRYLAGQKPAARQSLEYATPTPKSSRRMITVALAGAAGAIVCGLAGAFLYFHVSIKPAATAVATPIAMSSPASAPTPVVIPAPAPSAATQPTSPFAIRMNNGKCHLDGDTLSLVPDKAQCSLIFGSHTWTDYDLSFQAMTNAERGFWIQPRIGAGESNEVMVNAFEDNFAFVSTSHGTVRHIGNPRRFRLEPDHWYNVRLLARGPQIQLYLDGQEVFTESDPSMTHGSIGIGAHNSAARFRDIKVFSPAGELLWDGPTEIHNLPPEQFDGSPDPPPPAFKKVNLLASSRPHFDALQGIWVLRNNILSGNGAGAQLPFSYTPSGEYEYRISLTRLIGLQPIALIAAQDGHSFAWVIGGHRDTATGFAMLNGADYDNNNTTRQTHGGDKWLGNESKVTLVLRIAKNYLAAYVNGQLVDTYKTNFTDLTFPPTWRQQSTALGLWLGGDHVAIDAADVLTYSTPFNAPAATATTNP